MMMMMMIGMLIVMVMGSSWSVFVGVLVDIRGIVGVGCVGTTVGGGGKTRGGYGACIGVSDEGGIVRERHQ